MPSQYSCRGLVISMTVGTSKISKSDHFNAAITWWVDCSATTIIDTARPRYRSHSPKTKNASLKTLLLMRWRTWSLARCKIQHSHSDGNNNEYIFIYTRSTLTSLRSVAQLSTSRMVGGGGGGGGGGGSACGSPTASNNHHHQPKSEPKAK